MSGNIATYTVVGLMLDSALVGDLARTEAPVMLRANPMDSTILSDPRSIDAFADKARGRVELKGVKLIRVVASTLHLARHMFDPAVRNARPTGAELKDDSLSAADREVVEDLDRMWNMIELENRGRAADAPWAIPASAFDTLKKLGLFPYDARATVDDLAETLEKAGWIKVLFARDAQGRRKNIVLEPTLRFLEVIEAIDSGKELSFTPWKEVIAEAQKNSGSSQTDDDVTPPPNGGGSSATISLSRAPWDVVQAFVAAAFLGITSLLPGAAIADISTSAEWWSNPSDFVVMSAGYPSTTDIANPYGMVQFADGRNGLRAYGIIVPKDLAQIDIPFPDAATFNITASSEAYNENVSVKLQSMGLDEAWSGFANPSGMIHYADGRNGLRAYGIDVPKDLALTVPSDATEFHGVHLAAMKTGSSSW